MTPGNPDVWVNLVENSVHRHLHHLVVIFHLKEPLLLDGDAWFVATRSRRAPVEYAVLVGDIAVRDLCVCLHVTPIYFEEGVGPEPGGETEEVIA